MVDKKGYMKTLEAIIAVIVVLMVVIISLSFRTPDTESVPSDIEAMQDSIFNKLQNENRSLLFDRPGDIPIFLGSEIDELRFEYAYVLCDDVDCFEDNVLPEDVTLPQENIYVDSFVAQKYDEGNFIFRLFRLYIWYKEL